MSPDPMRPRLMAGRQVLIRRVSSSCSRTVAFVVRSDALASGQINMRKVANWQRLATAPSD